MVLFKPGTEIASYKENRYCLRDKGCHRSPWGFEYCGRGDSALNASEINVETIKAVVQLLSKIEVVNY